MSTDEAQRHVDELLARLHSHLEDLHTNPAATLDTRLFDEADAVLPNALKGDRLDTLLSSLATSLINDAGDPSVKAALLVKLFDGFTWTQICDFSGRIQYIPFKQGLTPSSEMVPINRLMLALLSKATLAPADAAHLATMLDPDPVIFALVACWLQTPDAGVAAQAQTLLLDLLTVDLDTSNPSDVKGGPARGQGLVWKRLFGDRHVYELFYTSCSLTTRDQHSLKTSQITLAQARLMEWLPGVGIMQWQTIVKSHHQDIELRYNVKGGLLDFAALHMVDTETDVLMHICLIDFFSSLLRIVERSDIVPPPQHDSPALRYLISNGLHTRSAGAYLQLPGNNIGPLDGSFLYGPSANYIATYASEYPTHYMTGEMASHVSQRLARVLDMSLTRWGHGESPKHDLHLLASLPRKSILRSGHNNILSLLPSRARNPDVFNTLAAIIHGPSTPELTFPPQASKSDEQAKEEASCARILYFQYLAANPRFWSDITTHADTVALKDVALASLNCLTAVITANWSTEQEPAPLPTTIACPDSGVLAVLSPPALEYTLPYLLKPPQTFANLVGGRGDTESAAYKIAVAKFDAVKAMHRRVVILAERNPGQGYDDIAATLGKRLQEGPMSREGEVGGRIGTLEL